MNIFNELKQIICQHSTLDITSEYINLDMDLVEHLGINSIAMILIIMDLEEKFDISIDNDDIVYSNLSQVVYLLETVKKLVGEKESHGE